MATKWLGADTKFALEAEPNITIVGATPDRDALYGLGRVVLAPSLWPEAFGIARGRVFSEGGRSISAASEWDEAEAAPRRASRHRCVLRSVVEASDAAPRQVHGPRPHAAGRVGLPAEGPGARGHTPILKPGDKFEYESGTSLKTRTGSMYGSFQFEILDDGSGGGSSSSSDVVGGSVRTKPSPSTSRHADGSRHRAPLNSRNRRTASRRRV